MSENLVCAGLAAFTMLCSAAAPAIDRAPITESRDVMVVVYTVPNLSNRMLDRALEEASAVLGQAGIDVSWTIRKRSLREADILDHPGQRYFKELDPACATFAPGACFITQVSDRFPETYIPKALGLSRPYGKDPGTVRATIFLERVTKLAARMGMSQSRLLGAVITHELGHVLSGTDAHGQGLMRDIWTLDDFHSICHRIPGFDTAEVRLMHLHLRMSASAAQPAVAEAAADAGAAPLPFNSH